MTTPTRELHDAAARRRIRDDTANTLFVEAAAGSGKTTGLVDRIQTLVLHDGVPIEHIAAVTFTERAAAELRDRLRLAFERSATGANGTEQEAALSALAGVDLAAIGTLHAFARRILGEHPIEAGIPPLLEVLDEVGSSVAADERWVRLRTELLDDPEMTDTLELALAVGVTLEHVRSLMARLNSDWDLVESHVVAAGRPAPPTLPDTTAILARARELAGLASVCTDPDDKFLPALANLESWANDHASSTADVDSQLASLQAAAKLRWGYGRASNWAGRKDEIKESCKQWQSDVADLVAAVRDTCLRCIVHWLGVRVLQIAAERRADGRLEFHDLLVLARNVLREVPEVRGSLQQRYQRLLLDEFQDTDPIQIEIAVRIAGGEPAAQAHWEDVVVPPGSLFVVGDPKQSIYRFRRADIGTYLRAQQVMGGDVSLSSNFRAGKPIVDWVNEVFGKLITPQPGQQPSYVPFAPVRDAATAGPSVTVVGAQSHEGTVRAGEVRRAEARDVAGIIRRALDEGWTTQAPTAGSHDGAQTTAWRPLTGDDIAILVPARTSLPYLEEALDEAAVEYRTESTSLVYHAAEVRDLFAALRAIADPSDAFALVTALRSPLFGCGDDDLWTWKRDGGRFSLFAEPPQGLDEHPVAGATAYLRGLHHASRRLSPSEVLTRLATDRRMFETAAAGPRARDSWRRLRFVIDQARAWSEAEHGGLRSYVAWAAAQSADGSRVAESVLPEQDMNSVRIMTVHAAKGLEFPMVVLSGMSSRPPGRTGVQLLWSDTGYAVRLSKDLQTHDFAERAPIDEQMSEYERMRLMYVATTRARDHLVVSLHRDTTGYPSNAKMLAKVGAHGVEGVHTYAAEDAEPGAEMSRRPAAASPPPEYEEWLAALERSRESSRRRSAQSASGLEGTDPEAHEADAVLPPEELARAAGLAKGARDLEQPAWAKGRYGSAVGRAVHGVMQTVPLADGDGLEGSVAAQCLAEDVSQFTDLVRALCAALLSSDVVRRAASREHWRESYVATVQQGGTVLEGFVDLIYREDDGSLVVVDYKTDDVPDAALASRTAFYAPQLRSYATVLARTGEPVSDPILLFARPDGVTEVPVHS